MLKLHSVQDKGRTEEGYRLLVMSEWPARFPESGADGFNPKLAPSPVLYEDLQGHRMEFAQFALKYQEELRTPADRLQKLKKQAKDFDIILITLPDFEGKSIGKILLDAIEQSGPDLEKKML